MLEMQASSALEDELSRIFVARMILSPSSPGSTSSVPLPPLCSVSSINSATTTGVETSPARTLSTEMRTFSPPPMRAPETRSSSRIAARRSQLPQELVPTSDHSLFSVKSEADVHEISSELEELNKRIKELEQELQQARGRAADLQSVFIHSDPSGNSRENQETERTASEDPEHTQFAEPSHSQVVEVSASTSNGQDNIKKRRLGSENSDNPGVSRGSIMSPVRGRAIRTPTPSIVHSNEGQLKSMNPDLHYIWFDLETTTAGIEPSQIRILEVAVLITDWNFNPLDTGIRFLVHDPEFRTVDDVTKLMPPKVFNMHHQSGLLEEWSSTPIENRLTLRKVEERVCKYLNGHCIYSRGLMSGAGVGFDKTLVETHMPKLSRIFNYQVFDTTTLWHIIRRQYGFTQRFEGQCKHRAMDDILGTIEEAKRYVRNVFKAPQDVPALHV